VTAGRGLVLGLYAAFLGSLLSPLYGPLSTGDDDTGALLVLLCAIHAGVGGGVARWWVLAFPVGLCLAAFVANGAEALAVLYLFLGLPVLTFSTALGVAIGRRLQQRSDAFAFACFAIAALPAAWAVAETLRRGPHVSAAVQTQLPTTLSLGNLCPGAETSPGTDRDLRRRTEVLIDQLQRRPNDLVTYTYYYSDDPTEEKDITVRELAQEQLASLEDNGQRCDPRLQRRLRDAM